MCVSESCKGLCHACVQLRHNICVMPNPADVLRSLCTGVPLWHSSGAPPACWLQWGLASCGTAYSMTAGYQSWVLQRGCVFEHCPCCKKYSASLCPSPCEHTLLCLLFVPPHCASHFGKQALRLLKMHAKGFAVLCLAIHLVCAVG